MNLLDLGIIILLGLIALRGYYRGLFQELAVLVGVVGGVVAAAHTYLRLAGLLQPWISDPELLKKLPLPTLIDIERRADSNLTAAGLEEKLRTVVSDARVDDHRLGAVLGEEALDYRNAECERLSRAGLCDTDDIFSFDAGSDCFLLDGRWR